jgi:hypothetical protein
MKAYFSYWSGGWQASFKSSSGPTKFIIDCHKLSAFLAKKHFKEIHFLTDSASLPYFKDIGYDSIECVLDNIDYRYNSAWAISKLVAYSHICKKGDPFIHIDNDVFLWDCLPKRLLEAEVFAQGLEICEHNLYHTDWFLSNCPELGVLKNSKSTRAFNVGIIGGNNVEFLSEYSKESLRILFDPLNTKFFFEPQPKHLPYWVKSVMTEQYLLTVMCDLHKVKCELLYTNKFQPINEDVVNLKYTHLMGAKHNRNISNLLVEASNKLNL